MTECTMSAGNRGAPRTAALLSRIRPERSSTCAKASSGSTSNRPSVAASNRLAATVGENTWAAERRLRSMP